MDRKQVLEKIKRLKGMNFEQLALFEFNHGLKNLDFRKYSNLYDTLVVSSFIKLLKKKFDKLLISVFHDRLGPLFDEKVDRLGPLFDEKVELEFVVSGLFVSEPVRDFETGKPKIPESDELDLFIIDNPIADWLKLSPKDVFEKLKTPSIEERRISAESDLFSGGLKEIPRSKELEGFKELSEDIKQYYNQLLLKQLKNKETNKIVLVIFRYDYGKDFVEVSAGLLKKNKLENKFLVGTFFETKAFGIRSPKRNFQVIKVCDNADQDNFKKVKKDAEKVKKFVEHLMKDEALLGNRLNLASGLIFNELGGAAIKKLDDFVEVIASFFT